MKILRFQHGERFLFAALGIFLIAKCLLILLPIDALGIPRHSDDSLYALWGGQQIQQGYDLTAPALSDIRTQAALQDKVSEFQEWYRSRALFRSVGTHSPVFDLANAAIQSTGLSWKWSYAVLEILVAIIMGTGIAVFLRQLFGGPAAAAGLFLLSFAILPLRGLHYFAANELALSGALFLWSYMLRRGTQSHLGVLILGWLVVLAIHPIGLIYLCAGLAMLSLAHGGPREWFGARPLTIAGTLIVLVAGFKLLTIALPFLGMENAFPGRGLNFGDGLIKNLSQTYEYLTTMTGGGIAIFVLAGLSCFTAARAKVLTRQSLAVIAAVFAPLIMSFFYFYPGYPGLVFARLLVPLVIILAGAAGALLAAYVSTGRRPIVRVPVGVAMATLFAFTAVSSYRLVIQNLNERPQIIEEHNLAAKIAPFPDKTNIIYLNADLTTNAVLLAGGARFGALIGPILANTRSGKQLIVERRPALVAITLPDWLNMHAAKGSRDLGERRYGVPFELVGKLLIAREQANRPLREAHAWVTNGTKASLELIVHEDPDSAEPSSDTGRRIKVPVGFSGWLRLDNWLKLDSQKPATQLLVTLPLAKGWIEGISLKAPRQDLRWPWTDNALLAILDRSNASGTYTKLRFSVPQLMAGKGARIFLPMIRRKDPILSDDSGIVFLNTVFAPGTGPKVPARP